MAKRSVLNVLVITESCADGTAAYLLAPLIISAHAATYESLKYMIVFLARVVLFFWGGFLMDECDESIVGVTDMVTVCTFFFLLQLLVFFRQCHDFSLFTLDPH